LRIGLQPNLQEMHALGRRGIEFTVPHARARAHALYIAGSNRRAVTERVFVGKLAREHVADDLHVAMPMRAEAGAGQHAILVDDAQRAEFDEPRIVVLGKRKAVKGLEPSVIGKSSFLTASHRVH
jgi:hypothetical protein